MARMFHINHSVTDDRGREFIHQGLFNLDLLYILYRDSDGDPIFVFDTRAGREIVHSVGKWDETIEDLRRFGYVM